MSSVQRQPNRDVGRQQAGFRLQRLRAAEMLLKVVDTNPEALVYAAVEALDDVNIIEASETETKQTICRLHTFHVSQYPSTKINL